MDCAGRVKPWKFQDTHALDVRMLDAQQWSKKVSRDMRDLDRIMKRELRFYLDKDLRIYESIEPGYEEMKSSLTKIDSVINSIAELYVNLKESPGDSLESVPDDSASSYREIIESSSKDIQIAKKAYHNGLKDLKKGFKKDRKNLVFIDNEYIHYKLTLHDIKYKREELEPELKRFNKKLSKALFEDDGSSYARNIRKISKKIESHESKLDVYEKFLSNIDGIILKEVGGHVILRPSKAKPLKVMLRHEKGLSDYLDTLEKIRKDLESI